MLRRRFFNIFRAVIAFRIVIVINSGKDREMQISILTGYRDFDFCRQALKLGVVRFLLKPSNMEELEEALQWLRDAGLAAQQELVEKPELPLACAADATYFKVYLSDTGLLRRRSGLSFRTIQEEDALFMRYKGSLAENYVLNELRFQGETPYFWRSGNTAEVDMLVEYDGQLIPMEVKSAENTQAKSYQQFCKRYRPAMGFKCSLKNIGENMVEQTRTVSLPLYLMWNWKKYVSAASGG